MAYGTKDGAMAFGSKDGAMAFGTKDRGNYGLWYVPRIVLE